MFSVFLKSNCLPFFVFCGGISLLSSQRAVCSSKVVKKSRGIPIPRNTPLKPSKGRLPLEPSSDTIEDAPDERFLPLFLDLVNNFNDFVNLIDLVNYHVNHCGLCGLLCWRFNLLGVFLIGWCNNRRFCGH